MQLIDLETHFYTQKFTGVFTPELIAKIQTGLPDGVKFPVLAALQEFGPGHILFGSDYPYDSLEQAVAFFDGLPLDQRVREAIGWKNAGEQFGL